MEMNLFMERTEVLSIPLYKYYGNLDYAKDVIENHRIHFESPKEYNDVYDSATYITDEQILSMYYPKELILYVLGIFASEKEEIEKFNKEFISLYDEMSEICIKDSIEGFVKSFPKYSFKTLLTVFRTVLSLSDIYTTDNPKITCFTENNDSLLMWSYYANSHKGVCLGFDLNKDEELLNHCYKVQYSKHFNTGDENYIFYTKSEEWQHEQEWRIVGFCSEYVETKSLKSIYLGAQMSSVDKRAFIELGKNYKLDVYYLRPSITEYKLEIKQFLKDGEFVYHKYD